MPTYQRHKPLLALLLTCVVGAACSAASQAPTDPGEDDASGGTPGSGGKGGSGGAKPSGKGGSGGTSAGSGGSGGTSAGTGGTSAGTGGSGEGGGGGVGSGGMPGEGGGPGGSGDDAGAPDTAPSSDGPGTLPGGMKVVYILHDANAQGSANDPSRKSLVDILNSMHDSHGIVVKMADSPTPAAKMADAALIIVGPNAKMFEDHPAPDLKTTEIPVIVTKDGNTVEIGLGTVLNTAAMYNTIKIIKNDHPLAAGLPLGTVQVNTTTAAQRMIRFTNVGPDAIKIATGPADNASYSIVAYEKGGMMANGFRAPAKRVGLFWHRPAACTADGAKLVKAAVDWILRP